MRLIVRPAAAADLEEAFAWYEDQRLGLGGEFLDAVDRTLQNVIENPRQHAVVHRDTRRAHVRHFPYSVFYRIVGDAITVVAFFHGRRHPRRWQARR